MYIPFEKELFVCVHFFMQLGKTNYNKPPEHGISSNFVAYVAAVHYVCKYLFRLLLLLLLLIIIISVIWVVCDKMISFTNLFFDTNTIWLTVLK